MKTKIAIAFAAAGILAGCASRPPEKAAGTGFHAMTLDGYKRDAALRISEANVGKVYGGRPQALLRSVVVVKYMWSMRAVACCAARSCAPTATALHALQASVPLPKPAAHLLHRGQLEVAETWLFNNDGRFQLRTIAEPQINE
ncbi:MAG TPA: hypothetical protein VHK70_08665 [Burkholderiaceae bacterium]|jgi:protein TonB|nr:hypothetical protein [Burkholderiaceae bacterium]